MGLTLYHGEPNGPSLTVLATLFEKGVDAELRKIDLAAGARHALPFAAEIEVAMSREGEGPVLIAPDGTVMTDSTFIALYLNDITPENPLRPDDAYGHYQLNMWCRFIIERVSPAAALLGTRASAVSANAAAIARIPSDDLRQRWQAARDGSFAAAQVADSEGKVRLGVTRTEQQLGDGDWILDAFSIADLETYAWLAPMVRLLPDAFADAPKMLAWLERVKARPAVQKALATAGTENPLDSWAPGPEINRWG
jgi:GST-like protein